MEPQRSAEFHAWAACRQGDWHTALRILVGAYGGDLHRYCARLLKEAEQADDLYQTVLLQAFRHLPAFSGRSSFHVWLHAIARHRCLDALKTSRRRARHVTSADERVLEQVCEDPHGTPEEVLLREAVREAVRVELRRLPSKTRQLLLLRYAEQLSYEEIAERCAVRPATLRVHVSRALVRLRHALDDARSA